MTSVKEETPNKQGRDVDLTAAGRGVWLVKVPKYLSEKWKKTSGKTEVGRLKITRSKIPNKMPEVTFSLDDQQVKPEVPGQLGGATPKDHKFLLTGVGNQNLVVFSEDRVTPSGPSAEEITEKIAIEGKVMQRAECRPVAIADLNYLKLKKQHVVTSNKPKREIKQIGKVVSNKPISHHPAEVAHQKKMKEDGKRIRQDKDKVMDKLFEIFEKHQYYNIQDLVRLTSQPITYLKEILKEICVYNVKAPHKNMWELRPEYRHYKA